MYREEFRRLFAEYLGVSPENIHLFWKGRVALYAILKALGIGEGDEVIVPAYTCVVVVNPIIYLGAKPVYVDIEPLTYNIDIGKIEGKITTRTKVIIAQNTYGLSPEMDGILDIAKNHGLHVVEDCAHGLGGNYNGRKNGTLGDASFFSTQWNKPFSTGLGGIVYTKDNALSERLRRFEEEWVHPSVGEQALLYLLMRVRKWTSRPALYWFALKSYRWLSKKNLILGSSQGYEIRAPSMPRGFLKTFSEVQAREGIKAIRELNGIIGHRIAVADGYDIMLRSLGLEPPMRPRNVRHTFLKYPLLVKDRREFFCRAFREHIPLGDWFVSPIHPVVDQFELWGYRWGENPIAEKISQHVVNLPTDPYMDEKYLERVRQFLVENRYNLYNGVRECLRD